MHDHIDKANAAIVVTPYSVAYNGLAHKATVASITGVNGETGATVGAVDVTGTSHTAAGDFPTDPWSFTATANYNNASGAMHDHIDKADAVIVVTPYSVAYNAWRTWRRSPRSSASTGRRARRWALDVTGTSHTNAGDFLTDSWSFTATANYNNASGAMHDHIEKADAAIVVTPLAWPTTVWRTGPTVASITGVTARRRHGRRGRRDRYHAYECPATPDGQLEFHGDGELQQRDRHRA